MPEMSGVGTWKDSIVQLLKDFKKKSCAEKEQHFSVTARPSVPCGAPVNFYNSSNFTVFGSSRGRVRKEERAIESKKLDHPTIQHIN